MNTCYIKDTSTLDVFQEALISSFDVLGALVAAHFPEKVELNSQRELCVLLGVLLKSSQMSR